MSSMMPTDQQTASPPHEIASPIRASPPHEILTPGRLISVGAVSPTQLANAGAATPAAAMPTDAQAVGQAPAAAAPPWLPIFKFGADHPSDGRSLIAAFGADAQVTPPKDTTTPPTDGSDPNDPRGKDPTTILQN